MTGEPGAEPGLGKMPRKASLVARSRATSVARSAEAPRLDRLREIPTRARREAAVRALLRGAR